MIKRAQWIGCYLAYKLWLWLPPYRSIADESTLYGRFNFWLLGHAGAYGYSEDFRDFCEHVRFR